ncbi:hypothetical protein V6N13_146444 [Hibiscus sabdariffa]
MFFDGGVNLPRKSRKYRQLDDDPSDGGGSDARPADVTLDQDRIAPKATSYKGSLLQNSTSLPSESDELMDEEDIIFEDGEVVRNIVDDSIPLPFPDRTSPLEEPPDKHAPPSQLPALRILVDTSQQYTQNVDANDETNTAQAGCGHWKFLPAARQILRDHTPDLVVFVEPRISGRKADSVIAAFGFPRLADTIHSLWVLFGDFNATLHANDRIGCIQTPSKAFQQLLFDYGLRDLGFQGPDFTWSRGLAQARLDRCLCNSYWDDTFPVSVVSYLLRLRSDHRPILLQVGNSSLQHQKTRFRYFS